MTRQPLKKIGGLLAATLLFASPSAFCGDTTALSKADGKSDAKTVVEKKPESNPLSFYDGKLVFDVQDRLRGEVRYNNYDFNSAADALTDDSFLLQRFRIGMLVKPVEWLKFYVQGQDSREIGSDRANIPGALGAEGDDSFDLRQAYVEISNYKECPWGLKVGRQILSYGDERLVGAFDWNNFGRTFDAVKLTYKGAGFSVDAFTSSPVVIWHDKFNKSDVFNQYGTQAHRDLFLSGIYLTVDPLPFGTWDFYTFMLDQAAGNVANVEGALTTAPVKGSLTAHSDFATMGTRIKGDPKKLHGWEFGGEFAYQAGKVRGLNLNAFAGTAGVGYNWLETPWKPRLYVEYNYASGDDSPASKKGAVTGNDINTFQNLFPTNHKFYGIMDLFSWQNLQNVMVSTRVSPLKNLTLQLDYNAFWLANTNDAWYRANGLTTVRPLNAAARRADSFAGQELDFVATWNATKYLQLQGGYSHFFAGAYLKDTGPHSDADFAYLQATITF